MGGKEEDAPIAAIGDDRDRAGGRESARDLRAFPHRCVTAGPGLSADGRQFPLECTEPTNRPAGIVKEGPGSKRMSRISRLARQSPVLLSAIAAVLLAAPQAEQPTVGVDIPPTGGAAADGNASVYRGHAQ
jgi:hypothetical protein